MEEGAKILNNAYSKYDKKIFLISSGKVYQAAEHKDLIEYSKELMEGNVKINVILNTQETELDD